ncbi:cardiolipin synthase, partial [Virgibacillus sp. 7505]
MIEVAQRGVLVSLILPEKADHPLVQHGATPYVIEALQAGVLVYHYYRGFYHVKAVVADQSACLVGTPNIDKR